MRWEFPADALRCHHSAIITVPAILPSPTGVRDSTPALSERRCDMFHADSLRTDPSSRMTVRSVAIPSPEDPSREAPHLDSRHCATTVCSGIAPTYDDGVPSKEGTPSAVRSDQASVQGGATGPDYSTTLAGTSMPLPKRTSRAAATRLGRDVNRWQ